MGSFLTALGNIVKDVAGPAAAARTGYLEGKEQKRQRQRTERMQDEQLTYERGRQSLLDQIKAEIDRSSIERNRAMTDWYDERSRGDTATDPVVPVVDEDGTVRYVPRGDASGKRVPEPVVATEDEEGNQRYTRRSQAPGQRRPPTSSRSSTDVGNAPKTRVREDGMVMQWDPENEKWFETGFKSRQATGSSGSTSQSRLNAQAALNAALKGVPRPSKTPQPSAVTLQRTEKGKIVPQPNPDALKPREQQPAYQTAVRDSMDYEKNVLEPLRKNLFDATVPGVFDKPDDANDEGLGKSASASSSDGGRAPNKELQTEAAAMYREAAEAYQEALAKGADPRAARTAYDRAVKLITQKYGFPTLSPRQP
jgi:hypothetical protein